jgi:hypothetical protein
MRYTLLLLFPIYLFGEWLGSIESLYSHFIESKPYCLTRVDSENEVQKSWGSFSSLSDEALEKLNRIDETDDESSWIPFRDTKNSLKDDFNSILDDLILSLTGDNHVLLCLQEMREINSNMIEEMERVVTEQESNLIADSNNAKSSKHSDSYPKIEKMKSDIEAIREVILNELKLLGLNLSDKELNALLVRVDSDDILQMMIIFDISKKIIVQLQTLMSQSGDNIKLARRYYGMNLVLSETAIYIQDRYIHSINQRYIPKLKRIITRVKELQKETSKLLKNSQKNYEKDIYKKNLQSQSLTLDTANLYINNLNREKRQVIIARERSVDNLHLTENSYKTLQVGANLLDLIKETRENFQRVMSIQFPEIVPFSNPEIESRYKELSEELREK